MKTQKIYTAKAFYGGGWAHSKPYKMKHAALKWAKEFIDGKHPVVIATYASFEDFIAAEPEGIESNDKPKLRIER